MGPNEEADHGDGDTGASDERVTEDRFAREGGHDLADHTHSRQDHDVDSRMRIKPEQMLEENGIAAERGIEEAEMKHALESGEKQCDGNYRRAKNEDDAGGALRPNEDWQAEPGHAGRTHSVHGDDQIHAGEDRCGTGDEDAYHLG